MLLGEYCFARCCFDLGLIEMSRESLGNKGWGWEGKHYLSKLDSTLLTIE